MIWLILDHPRFSLLVALILGGLALSGRFSVTAARALFVFAWLVGCWSIYGFEPLRSHHWWSLFACVSFGVVLGLLGVWVRPEAIPLNVGRLVAKKPILVWSRKAPLRTMEFGDSNAMLTFAGPAGESLFRFFDDSELTIEQQGSKLLVSTKIRDKSSKGLVAELFRNEWKVYPTAWDRNYTNDALEVRNADGDVVLQIRLLPDRIQLQGEWWGPDGRGVRIAKCTDSKDGSIGGCLVVMTPQYHPKEPVIQPIFEYPSELHLGEQRKRLDNMP